MSPFLLQTRCNLRIAPRYELSLRCYNQTLRPQMKCRLPPRRLDHAEGRLGRADRRRRMGILRRQRMLRKCRRNRQPRHQKDRRLHHRHHQCPPHRIGRILPSSLDRRAPRTRAILP